MAYERIKLETEGALASIVLNRPEARNAMTGEMGDEIARAVAEINAREETRCVLVRAEGAAFAAGGDFKYLEARAADDGESNRRAMRAFYEKYLSVRALRVPSIAVIQGPAVGAGLCFALACDIRLAARGAKMGLNFTRLGLHPGMGGSWLLPRLVGEAKAAELLFTGRLIEAEEAARVGMVNAVHEPEALLAAARAMAEEIARSAPIAVAQTKGNLYRNAGRSLAEALDAEAYAQAIDYATEDMKEGIRSFHEKRAPVFKGK